MKISPVQTYKYTYTSPKPKNISFSSLKLKNDENDFSDTSFYRDIQTLMFAAHILKQTFPNGTDIMDFACSNGEEAISLYSFLNDTNNNKYKIYCYDKSDKAVELGQKGIYTVFSPQSYDYFLLPGYTLCNTKNEVRRCFNEMMHETGKPDYEINDIEFINQLKETSDFRIKYYKLKDRYRDKIEINKGDINNIEKLLPEKKAGAILFRNAMYIETGNLAVNEFSFNEDLSINKKEVIEKIVDKVYDKLLPGGLFILGDVEKDHIYIADNKVKDEDKIFLRNFGTYVYKKPPLWEALAKDDRFEPVLYKKVASPAALGKEEKVPTVWRKK